MVTPYAEYVDVCEALRPAHARRPREALGAVQLRRRGGGERGEDRPRAHQAAGGRRLRPRLPRPHQPHDGADREEHAVQALVRPVRARGLPGADVLPVPRPGGHDRRAGRGPRARPGREAGGCGQRGLRRHRADPGRGRLRRPGAGLPAGAGRRGAPTTARCSSPTRSRPASPAPATGSPATPRASCPTWSPPPRASPAACRWPPSPAAPRSWTRRTSAASAARTAATRSPAPRRSAASRRWSRSTSAAPRGGSAR